MPYSDFTLDSAQGQLQLTVKPKRLFPNIPAGTVPEWLPGMLAISQSIMPLTNEKSRSEGIVTFLLMAAAKGSSPEIALFSGQRLDVDDSKGLMGECDFILARAPVLPRLQAPILTVVEAKNADIVLGLGQCIAQMEGAKIFNQKAGLERDIYGCVTTGELWQFLHMRQSTVWIDDQRYPLEPLERLLGVFHLILN